MTTSRINAYRWPARLVSHKPFAAERYFITSSSIWQVFFAENYDFSFLFSLFCQQPHFLCKMHNLSAFCRWKTPPFPFAASVWAGQVKEGSQMALFSFISLSMRLPFSCSRTSPYATLHNLPAIWCKSGVVVGVVDFRPKCPVYRSDLQRNGLWLPWWLLRKSPSWC